MRKAIFFLFLVISLVNLISSLDCQYQECNNETEMPKIAIPIYMDHLGKDTGNSTINNDEGEANTLVEDNNPITGSVIGMEVKRYGLFALGFIGIILVLTLLINRLRKK